MHAKFQFFIWPIFQDILNVSLSWDTLYSVFLTNFTCQDNYNQTACYKWNINTDRIVCYIPRNTNWRLNILHFSSEKSI